MVEDFTPEEMEMLRILISDVREVKNRLGALASTKASANEDIISRIMRLQDEEYETAHAILTRCDRIDNTLSQIRGHLDALNDRKRDDERRAD